MTGSAGTSRNGAVRRRLFVLLTVTAAWSALAAVAVLDAAAPAAAATGGGTPVVIDDFSTAQSALTLTFPPAGTSASSSASGAGILGGERDMKVDLTAGVIAGNTVSAAVSSGFFSYSQDATISGSTTLSWDGTDGTSTVVPTGLGGTDLTVGGSQNAFDLGVVFDDLPVTVTLTVRTDAANASSATVTLPGLIFSAAHVVVPFTSFTTIAGSGANFANVGAMELTAGSSVTAPDLVLDSLTTDALVAAPMTAALTSDVNGNLMADPGDHLTYTTVISNPDDLLDAPSTGTKFAFTPGAGSSLIAGSVTTTQGSVTTGNTPGDTSVAVNLGTIADGASATVQVTVTVLPTATSLLSAQGTVSSDSLSALLTDDPAVPGTVDPTVTPVVVSAVGLRVCVHPDLDLRAPYADGTCPSGFRQVNVQPAPTGGLPVCVKVKTNWRSPYADGTCPSGYSLVHATTTPTGGELACVKVKTDVRAPDSAGCPTGYQPVRLAVGAAG